MVIAQSTSTSFEGQKQCGGEELSGPYAMLVHGLRDEV